MSLTTIRLPPRQVPVLPPPAPEPVDLERATRLGSYRMRFYWVAEPSEGAEGRLPVFDPSCRVLTRVSRKVRDTMRLEGTARLADGTLLNIWGRCRCSRFPCFKPIEPSRPWGLGVKGHHLSPFRSIAVDPRYVPIGTPVYIAELDGLAVPGVRPFGGFVHDGCVVAADRGGNIRGHELDFFVANHRNYRKLRRHAPPRVNLYKNVARCRDRSPDWTPDDLAVVRDALQRGRDFIGIGRKDA